MVKMRRVSLVGHGTRISDSHIGNYGCPAILSLDVPSHIQALWVTCREHSVKRSSRQARGTTASARRQGRGGILTHQGKPGEDCEPEPEPDQCAQPLRPIRAANPLHARYANVKP